MYVSLYIANSNIGPPGTCVTLVSDFVVCLSVFMCERYDVIVLTCYDIFNQTLVHMLMLICVYFRITGT